MKFNFNVFMVIWCAGWVLYSLLCMFSGSPILIHLIYISFQLSLGTYYALEAKEPFCNFFAKIKRILRK